MVALGQGVEDGEEEVGHHQKHQFLKQPGQEVAVLCIEKGDKINDVLETTSSCLVALTSPAPAAASPTFLCNFSFCFARKSLTGASMACPTQGRRLR